MTHPLVDQLRFARSEFARCLAGVGEEDAVHRLDPMNSLSWIVGHLADQENRYWVFLAQGQKIQPELRHLVGFGRPASTPPLEAMWQAWREVTATADRYLDGLDAEILQSFFVWKGEPLDESIGTLLLRNIYHYWYHTGEASAVRQMLGHAHVPEFVGEISRTPYRTETGPAVEDHG